MISELLVTGEEDYNSVRKITGKEEYKGLSYFKLLIFEAFARMACKSQESNQNPRTRTKLTISAVLKALQLVSFLWHWSMDISDWEDLRIFWKVLGYPRFDLFLMEIGAKNFMLYIATGFIWLTPSFLVLLGFFATRKKTESKGFKYLVSALVMFTYEVAYLPFGAYLAILLRHFLFGGTLTQYFDQIPETGIYKLPLIVVNLTVLLAFKYVYIVCTTEKNHFKTDNPYCISSTAFFERTELLKVVFVAFYAFSSPGLVYYIVFVCVSLLAWLQFVVYTPFYQKLTAKLVSGVYLYVGFLSFIFLTATLSDNSYSVILIAILITPLVLYMQNSVVEKRYQLFYFEPLGQLVSQDNLLKFELQLRPYMKKELTQDPKEVVRVLSNCLMHSSLKKQKMLPLWSTYYIYYSAENLKLAKLKFTQCLGCHSNFSDDFEEFKCKKLFKGSNYQESKGYKLVKSFILSEKILKKDKKFCLMLVSYWREFMASKPTLEKLEKMTKKLSRNLKKLLEMNYKMITKHPENSTSTRNFEEFAGYFIFEPKQQSTILSRCQLTRNFTEKAYENFKLNSPTNAILLLSGEPSSTGEITYANQIASELLKQPISNLIGSNIDNFIPPPFNIGHSKKMNLFLKKTLDAKFSVPENFIFMLKPTEIMQVKVKIKLLAFHSHPFFLVSFKKDETKSEIAIISDTGVITCHSLEFGSKLTPIGMGVIGTHINDYIPDLDLSTAEPFVPFQPEYLDLLIVPLDIKVQNSILKALLLVDDQEEINNWKTEEIGDHSPSKGYLSNHFKLSPGQNDHKNSVTFSEFAGSISYEELEKTHTQKLSSEHHESEPRTNFIEPSVPESSSASSQCLSQSKEGKKIIQKGFKSIRFYRWTVIISILTVLVTNSAIIFYIQNRISDSGSIDYLHNFDLLRLRVSCVATNARRAYHAYKLGDSNYEQASKDNIKNCLNELDVLMSQIEFESNWLKCPESKSHTMDIHFWEQSGKDSYDNLLNIVNEFSSQTAKFLEVDYESQAGKDSQYYIVINGIGSICGNLELALKDLKECEKEKVYDLDATVYLLLSVAVLVLLVCFGVLSWSSNIINYNSHQVWNFLRSNIAQSYFELKNSCLDRLSSLYEEILEDQPISSVNNKKEVNFRRSFKYIMRISVFLGFSCLYYLLMFLVVYRQCVNLLLIKPDYTSMLHDIQADLSLVDFWTREKVVSPYEGYKLVDLLPKSYIFESPEEEYQYFSDKITEELKFVKESEETGMLSSDTKKALLETTDSEVVGLTNGFVNGCTLYLLESSFVLSVNEESILDYMIEVEELHKALFTQGFEIIRMVDEDFSSQVSFQLNILILLAAGYTVCSVLMYYINFRPFLLQETQKLEDLSYMGILIPAERKYSKSRTSSGKALSTKINN